MARGIAAGIAALALIAAAAPPAGADDLLVVRGAHVTRVNDPSLPPADTGAGVGYATRRCAAGSPPKLPPPGQPCVAGVGYSLPRLAFSDDPVVFQWYPGHGLQIQVLGNFGKANALAENCLKSPPDPKAPCMADRLKALLDRLVALRVTRSTYTTWEYDFAFGGGKAPWVSGMAQATALQALARGAQV